jgi:hypothetical protein
VSDDTTELTRAYEYLSAARTEAHNIQAFQRHGDGAHAAERISDLIAWLASLDTAEEPSGLRADNERLRAIVTDLAKATSDPEFYALRRRAREATTGQEPGDRGGSPTTNLEAG